MFLSVITIGELENGVTELTDSALIAATGLQNDLTVVTRDTADLERCGARCFNPWIVR